MSTLLSLALGTHSSLQHPSPKPPASSIDEPQSEASEFSVGTRQPQLPRKAAAEPDQRLNQYKKAVLHDNQREEQQKPLAGYITMMRASMRAHAMACLQKMSKEHAGVLQLKHAQTNIALAAMQPDAFSSQLWTLLNALS